MRSVPKPPAWFADEPEIREWLHRVLKRLQRLPAEERKTPIRFTVNARQFPTLYHQGPEADERWEKIKCLKDYLPLGVALARRADPFAAEYEDARLELDPSCEAILRDWLQRPMVSPEHSAWRQAVEPTRHCWSDVGYEQLLANPLHFEGRTAEEIVAALAGAGRREGRALTQREWSARVFFGDSKFIENRCGALMDALYPALTSRPRALLVSVSLPSDPQGVLFIENHDTYVRAVQGGLSGTERMALVYSSGFLGSASRIRQRDGALLHYQNGSESRASFEEWWYGERACGWPVAFFGDLDFEGMRILKGLRGQFGASAWVPGYGRLLSLLEADRGYQALSADKNNQRPVDATGCPYTDGVLLPALKKTGMFVDQEAF